MANEKHDPSRREFVRKAAYAAPVVLSLNAVSSVAKAGSGAPPTTGDCDPPPPPKKNRR